MMEVSSPGVDARSEIQFAIAETSMGPIVVAASETGICWLSFGGDEAAMRRQFPNARLQSDAAEFRPMLDRVIAAVEEPGADHDIPLDMHGTEFQESVWNQLRLIPSGETRTYTDIAAAAGRPGAVRAAGGANGANRIAVLIPCHRVVRADGSIGGYAYGAEIKRELLRREGAHFSDQGAGELDLFHRAAARD